MSFNNIKMKVENDIKNNGEVVNQIENNDNVDKNCNNNNNNNNNNQNNVNNNNNNNRLRKGRKNRRIGNKVDIKAKLERSRQSARECRARKKLRYQYLEDLVIKRERANLLLKKELEMFREITKKIDSGQTPLEAIKVEEEKRKKQ